QRLCSGGRFRVKEKAPAQRGTALHMVMQYLNYDRTGSLREISDEVTRLVAGQYITPQQGEAVNPADILDFFQSGLGQRLRKSQRVEREFKFSLLTPAADYYEEAEPGEEVLLQGVVDCWFAEEDGTVTVVDFKTDRVSENTVARRAEEYRPQLDAYTRALSQAAGVTVGHRYLWFFSVGQALAV
ncbi:MAG: PD-(D/E)XK nuclease family protein, partial [Oscillospiraceae bacterium]|nr:PD-(D/E)XK nuclease family protein [Oscillospiraceae bacterium]